MQVSGWSNGAGTCGLRIGLQNRDQFFDSSWTSIEILIDKELVEVPVSAGFWNQCPEVRHPRLREWLREHRTLEWPRGRPPKAELRPVADRRFRLIS